MTIIRRMWSLVYCCVLVMTAQEATATDLKVKVLKACPDCVLEAAPAPCQSSSLHVDRSATWVPETAIRIQAVSIPEQTEVAIYTDIEVSTAPEMYLPEGHIFRVKYAGPGVLQAEPCAESFLGSNITTTNIVFPAGYAIRVEEGTPVYVHLDIKNRSSYHIDHMTQDVYVYYTELPRMRRPSGRVSSQNELGAAEYARQGRSCCVDGN